jgi:broad specificity phosphatase PhoE
MPTNFVFVRHAEGYHNLDEKIRGDISFTDPINLDAILTDYGINQAKSNTFGDEKFDAIFCSPMRRCKQTLLNMYPRSQSLPVIVDDRLIEQPQGKNISNKRLEKNDPKSYTPMRWNTNLVSETNPFVVDVDKDIENIMTFTKLIKDTYPNGKVLIVSHGKWIHNWLMIYKNKSKWINNCECIRESL